MRDRTSSFAMSAVVVGTYLCALYGAFGNTVTARPPLPGRSGHRAVQQAARPPAPPATGPAVATVSDAE